MSFSSYVINCSRQIMMVCPPITATIKGKYRFNGGAWQQLSGKDNNVPFVVWSGSKSKYPTGHGPGTSGTVQTIAGNLFLVEFDWNENGTADSSTYVEFPDCEITVFYPGNPAVGALNFTIPAATINISAGAERYVNVNDPLPVQGDSDGDGIPDESDPDDDNDGIPDELDLFPKDPAESGDNDGDGVGDNADPDRDGDGVPNDLDKFPNNGNESGDHDGDGVGDNADGDDDNDGKSDASDSTPRGPVGNPDAGGGDQDNGGDGNGNPAVPGWNGAPPINGGDDNEELGDLGSPGKLAERGREWLDGGLQGEGATGEVPGLEGVAVDGFLDGLKTLGEGMRDSLGSWHPFESYQPTGDMTTFQASLGRVGTVSIPFPVQGSNMAIFRGCCLFALYWGAVLSAMRILKI